MAGAPEHDPPHPNRDRLDAMFRADPYLAWLGAELVDWGPGTAHVRFTPSAEQRNFHGTPHGGVVFGLGDVALSVASNSWGRQAVALSVEVQYLAAAPDGAEIHAHATERSRTRRTASYRIEVTSEGAPVAALQAMAFRRSHWFLGDDAWPDDWRAAH